MKYTFPKSILSLALTASLFGSAAWSTNSYACASDPYISSVCIMAAMRNSGFDGYVLANGATLQVNQYQALYSLLGNTYGGNGTTFQLPDLRGRVVVGAGSGPDLPSYQVGAKGGLAAVTLTTSQIPIPAHNHGLTANTDPTKGVVATATIGNLAANTTLTGLTATTTIGTLAATTNVSGLTATLKASSGGGGTSNPSGATLATLPTASKIYTSTAPDTAMNVGNITVGGSATTTLSGNPATTITGTPTTTLSGRPGVNISGVTDMNAAGASTPVKTMPPYLALNYYIAVTGLYPSWQ